MRGQVSITDEPRIGTALSQPKDESVHLEVGYDCFVGTWKIPVSGMFTSPLSPLGVTAMAAAGPELQLCSLNPTMRVLWTV